MILYRFSRKEHGGSLNGKGAELYGGRWNSKGVPVVYTSESRALAVTEIIAYTPPGLLPEGYQLNIIEAPEIGDLQYCVSEADLPADWKRYPHGKACKHFGDALLADNQYLLIRVPSALVQGEYNWLINPRHPEMRQIKLLDLLPFNFNERLFR